VTRNTGYLLFFPVGAADTVRNNLGMDAVVGLGQEIISKLAVLLQSLDLSTAHFPLVSIDHELFPGDRKASTAS